MSVEDAREAMRTAVTRWDREMRAGDAEGGEQMLDEAIDRLILEVQAEFPCQAAMTDVVGRSCAYLQKLVAERKERYGQFGRDVSPPLCPSCTARKQLTEVTA